MLLNNLSNKEIKEISKTVAPKLLKQPAFMFYCKNTKDRQSFIEDFFYFFLNKWNKKEIVLTNESYDVIVSLVDIENYHSKDKGRGAAKLKRYKNPYANVQYHQGNVSYLANIVAPANIKAKIMTVYATLKYSDVVGELVDEAIKLAEENDFMIVYETFSKKAIDYMGEKGFLSAYEKQFQGTQYYETVMTYYKRDASKPAKLIDDFVPIVIDKEPGEEESEDSIAEYSE